MGGMEGGKHTANFNWENPETDYTTGTEFLSGAQH